MVRNARLERANETREVFLDEYNWLEIPNAVKQRFESEGYTLKWVRIKLKNDDDYKNIGLKLRDGWTFVTPQEAPEMSTGFQIGESKLGSLVVRGDVALAKAPIEKIKAKKQRVRERTAAMTAAINANLMEHSDRRMPITNSSVSRVSRGKTAQFDED